MKKRLFLLSCVMQHECEIQSWDVQPFITGVKPPYLMFLLIRKFTSPLLIPKILAATSYLTWIPHHIHFLLVIT